MAISTDNIEIYKVSAVDITGDLYDITKISIGEEIVYTAGNTVTYCVDTDVVYQEEVDAGETVLSPKTFTPTKSGWTFVGWRQDKSANGTVLNSLSMGDDPIELYAVFRQTVSLSYNGNGYTGGTAVAAQTGNMYYNNGNVLEATFTVNANTFTKTAYSFSHWRLNDDTSGTAYLPDALLTLSANATLYAEWTYVGAPVSTFPQNLSWTFSDQYNVSKCRVESSDTNGTIRGDLVDDTKESHFVATSQNINTNGNKTLEINVVGQTTAGYEMTVNGRTVYSISKATFDISNVSVINIKIKINAWAYTSGGCYIRLGTISLY